jgi:hypothetical protein
LKEIINFSTKFESLEQVNPLITKYRINICVPDKPANKYIFSKEVIEGMSTTIRGAGVYAYYFENDKQFGGHSDDIIKTKYGYKRTGEPVAYGFSDPYKEPYWMEKNGELWYTADVYLWTARNPEIEVALQSPVFHSMEVAVDDEEDESGNKIVKEAIFLGFCLLQGIQPAFENSTIEKFSLPVENSEVDLLKQEYAQFTNTNQKDLNVLNVEGQNPDTLNKTELSLKEDDSKEINKEGDDVIKEAVEKFSLNANQIHEILNNALSEYKYKYGDGEYEYRKYWVRTYDAELVYVSDYEFDKTYSFKYTIDGNVASVDMESKDEVIDGGYISVNKKDIETEHMASNDINTEATAAAELNNKQAEVDKELNDEGKEKLSSEKMPDMEDKEHMLSESESNAMKSSMDEMKSKMEEMKKLMDEMKSKMEMMSDENNKLKEEKLAKQEQEKLANIEFILQEVSDSIPKEKIEELREDSKNFSLENITIWENKVKAEAFSFSKGKVKDEGFTRMGLPHSNKSIKKGTGIWDNI